VTAKLAGFKYTINGDRRDRYQSALSEHVTILEAIANSGIALLEIEKAVYYYSKNTHRY
jgi:predicted Rossmann fold nucleotide-binding protein DprA/Smf involved in DNA uptake